MDRAADFKQQLEVPPASAQRHLLTSNHPQFDSGSDSLIHVSSDWLFSFYSTSCLIEHHRLCVFTDGREVKGDVHTHWIKDPTATDPCQYIFMCYSYGGKSQQK